LFQLLGGVIAVGLLVCLAGEWTGRFWMRALGKTTASAAFVAMGLTHHLWADGLAGRAVIVALVLSLLGDLALLSSEKRWFIAGLSAFLLGHVAYGRAFVALGVSWPGVAAGAGVMLLVGGALWLWMAPHLGKMRLPVGAYLLVISAMVALSVGSAVHERGDGRLLACAAAIVFAMSDVAVARQRFIAPGFWNRGVGLPLYYAAQVMFIAAIHRAA